jgi:hypothetical protein
MPIEMFEGPPQSFRYGSIWVRADFHLHTDADKEFCFGGDANYFARDFVKRLVEEEVRVGVITNHNKFDVPQFKELRKNAEKQDIFLLPGVELSVGDGTNGVHCLIAFDESSWLKMGQDHPFRSLSGSAPRPASVQKDSIIWAAILLAAAISLVPVLRNTSRRPPSTEGAVNRTCQSFLPAGGCWRNIFRVVQRTGMSNLGSFICRG